jgi:hypothetical protein
MHQSYEVIVALMLLIFDCSHSRYSDATMLILYLMCFCVVFVFLFSFSPYHLLTYTVGRATRAGHSSVKERTRPQLDYASFQAVYGSFKCRAGPRGSRTRVNTIMLESIHKRFHL